jgi:hypothetical protein
MFMAIAVALVAIAIVVFVRDADQLVQTPARGAVRGDGDPGGERRPVHRGRPRTGPHGHRAAGGGGFRLQPFLVIGIISATRDILTVGAELSLAGHRLRWRPR